MTVKQTKCCIISIVGRPNAGKSTLTNSLLGQKVSIVTPKVQTTRTLMKGILTIDDTQIIIIDTPGIFSAKKTLEKSMVKTALHSLEEGIDFIFHIVDSCKGLSVEDKSIIEILRTKHVPILVVLNKTDLIEKNKLLPLAKELYDCGIYKEVFMTSALNSEGLDSIVSYLQKSSPLSPWLYPEEEITTISSRLLASEITREKLFLLLDKELPYNLTVETENIEQKPNSLKINQIIYVTKENHKKIILGQKGKLIKQIGITARKELEKLFEKKVHLFLFVKVRENWMNKPDSYSYMGMQKP